MLLVEDEKETLDVVAATLAMKYPGVALYAADTGANGVEMFAAHLPDIVITDINMPNMNGVQMISTIRVLKPATKFIVLTADSRKRTSATSVGDGVAVDHCLLKPVTFAALFAAIDQCIGEISTET